MTARADLFRALSLGWGVQSFTLASMVALGVLESVDVAVHADTTHERSATYEFAERWTPWLENHGVRVVTVQEDTKNIELGQSRNMFIDIPAFTDFSGKVGAIKRQCTESWKIAPLRRWVQANRNGKPVEMWMGISMDEALRMKPSNVKYITNRWPLIERGMSRADCVRWLKERGLEVPPKSSCVFCPYHNRRAWAEMKREGGSDWTKAVEIDRQIRDVRPGGKLYVHRDLIPLDQVDLRSEEERGQYRLWDEECEGVCGI